MSNKEWMKDLIEWMTRGIDPFQILTIAVQVHTNLTLIIIRDYSNEVHFHNNKLRIINI